MRVEFDKHSLIVDGKRIVLRSGSIHYFRTLGEKEWYESADISEEKKQDAIKDIEDNIIQLNQDILLDIQEIQTQD